MVFHLIKYVHMFTLIIFAIFPPHENEDIYSIDLFTGNDVRSHGGNYGEEL